MMPMCFETYTTISCYLVTSLDMLNSMRFPKISCMKTLLQMKLESHSDYESMLRILTSTLLKGNSEGEKSVENIMISFIVFH